jgi:hypothetical protein
MNSSLKLSIASLGAILTLQSASALNLTSSNYAFTEASNSNLNASDVETITGEPAGSLEEVYKVNTDASPGINETWFTFTPVFTGTDITGGTLHWTDSLPFVGDPIYLLVKDGRQALPAPNVIWDLLALGWDGSEDIVLVDPIFSNAKNISHISVFTSEGGGRDTGTPTPDGGATALLLGVGLLGLAAARKK